MLKSTFFCFAKAVCWKFFVFCSLSFELFMIHSSPFVTWDSMGIFKVYWFVKLPGVLAVWVGWTIRCQNLVAIQRSKTKVPATLYTCSTGHTVDIYFFRINCWVEGSASCEIIDENNERTLQNPQIRFARLQTYETTSSCSGGALVSFWCRWQRPSTSERSGANFTGWKAICKTFEAHDPGHEIKKPVTGPTNWQ